LRAKGGIRFTSSPSPIEIVDGTAAHKATAANFLTGRHLL
jgi:hypothetical protein